MVDILNTKEKMKPCVSVDWLEVYCLESNDRYPCNADYFRTKGYFVNERDYGTRQYAEMFTIEDEHGEPWIEIRRNPMSGQSEFSGLNPMSTHIRLVNRHCYFDDAIEKLRNFTNQLSCVCDTNRTRYPLEQRSIHSRSASTFDKLTFSQFSVIQTNFLIDFALPRLAVLHQLEQQDVPNNLY